MVYYKRIDDACPRRKKRLHVPALTVVTLATLRRLLLALLVVGLVGTATELLLTGHDEDAWQLIPLVVLGMALVASLVMSATIAVRPENATPLSGCFKG